MSALSGPVKKVVIPVFIILLAGALVFYRQRMLFIDPAWVSFNILNSHSLQIEQHRYGAFITQIVPLTGSYLHLSLKTILIAYSASFYVFYLSVLLLLVFRYRQYELALLFGLYCTLFVSDVYYWPNNEVHQGIAWMFLFFAAFFRAEQKSNVVSYAITATCLFLAIFSHFLVILPLSFLWLFYGVMNRAFTKKSYIACTALIILLFFIKYRLGIAGWYDSAKLESVRQLGFAQVKNSFLSAQAKDMYRLMIRNYWLAVLVYISGLVVLLLNKKYLLVILCLCYTAGYFSLICITYPDAITPDRLFYYESEWMALAVIIATPFVFFLLPRLKTPAIYLLLIFLFTCRLAYIGLSFRQFNDRYRTVAQITGYLHDHHISKAMVLKGTGTDKALIMDWGIPVESMCYAAIQHYDPQVTFIIRDSSNLQHPGRDTFLTSFSRKYYRELNSEYFRIDTSAEYKTLSFDEVFKIKEDHK